MTVCCSFSGSRHGRDVLPPLDVALVQTLDTEPGAAVHAARAIALGVRACSNCYNNCVREMREIRTAADALAQLVVTDTTTVRAWRR